MRRSNPTFRSWTKSGLLPFRSPPVYEGVSLYLSYLLAHRAGKFYLLPSISCPFVYHTCSLTEQAGSISYLYLLPSISCLLSPAFYLLPSRYHTCSLTEQAGANRSRCYRWHTRGRRQGAFSTVSPGMTHSRIAARYPAYYSIAWKGAIQYEPEFRVLFKTTAAHYQRAIRKSYLWYHNRNHAVLMRSNL
jgi:hypothetical protein